MSNLSDLLPSGAGGKNVTFTASGSITQGDSVVINSDGTVSVVAEATQAVSSPQTVVSSNIMYSDYSQNVVYVPVGGYTVFFWTDSGGTTSYAAVGTNSGTSTYTMGATTALADLMTHQVAIYDSATDRVILAYEELGTGNQYGHAVVGEITTPGGTPTITFGTPTAFASSDTNQVDICMETNTNKLIVVWRNQGNGRFDSIVGDIVGGSTNSVSFPSSYVQIKSTYPVSPKVAYNSQENKIGAQHVDQTSYTAYGNIGTLSGNTITWSAEATVGNSFTTEASGSDFLYDPSSNLFFTLYANIYNANVYYATGEIASGLYSSLAFGTVSPLFNSNQQQIRAVYNAAYKNIILSAREATGGGVHYTNSTAMNASTGIPTWASAWVDPGLSNQYYNNLAVVSDITKVVSFYIDYSAPGYTAYGTTEFYTPSGTNVEKFTGIADATISDGSTGDITLKGGIASNGLSGLTPNSVYYVADDGTISTTSTGTRIGKALSTSSINLEFET